ncbi:MAG: hypothetical protein ACE5R5_06825 [Nitrosarchaeum sp.]
MKRTIYNELPVIIWKESKKLKWSDFKKTNKPNFNASAVSAIGFQSKPIIEHIKNKNTYRFKIREMQFNAIFIPQYSWYGNKISKKDQVLLLKHEQGHFDLAEEITRKESKTIKNNFQNKIFKINGKNEDAAVENAIYQVKTLRNKIEKKLEKKFEIQETKYDNETNHGLIEIHQKAYNKRFRKLRK